MKPLKGDKIEEGAAVATLQGPRWCVCVSQQHQEKLAYENLVRQDFEAYLPLLLGELKKRGRPTRIVSRPLFPRYLFVRIDLATAGWRSLYGTRGIASVIGGTERPSVMSDRAALMVDAIRAAEEDGFIKLKPADPVCQFKKGDKVTWKGLLEATFHEMVDDRRVRIFTHLLGTDSEQIVDLGTLL